MYNKKIYECNNTGQETIMMAFNSIMNVNYD